MINDDDLQDFPTKVFGDIEVVGIDAVVGDDFGDADFGCESFEGFKELFAAIFGQGDGLGHEIVDLIETALRRNLETLIIVGFDRCEQLGDCIVFNAQRDGLHVVVIVSEALAEHGLKLGIEDLKHIVVGIERIVESLAFLLVARGKHEQAKGYLVPFKQASFGQIAGQESTESHVGAEERRSVERFKDLVELLQLQLADVSLHEGAELVGQAVLLKENLVAFGEVFHIGSEDIHQREVEHVGGGLRTAAGHQEDDLIG